jgi:DNA replication and repair protein RecF
LYISSLHLHNFRNYEEADVEFSASSNLILGDNGLGKTNLLEAIFVLSTSKSFRRFSDRKLTRWGADGYLISGDFLHEDGERSSIALQYLDRKKTLIMNGVREERISAIIGRVYAVLLSFEDILLVTGPPVGRRGFMDLVLSTTDPLYFSTLKNYLQILRQKNRYLYEARDMDLDLLQAWNEQLVRTGSYIVEKRLGLVEFYNRFMLENGDALQQFEEPLRLEYRSTVGDLDPDIDVDPDSGLHAPRPGALDRVQDLFGETLSSRMNVEFRLGHAVFGPHRDDFRFSAKHSEIRYFGSVGEARLASIVLKLAQASFYRMVRNVHPIVLVDDVLLELDGVNRNRVLSLFFEGSQIIITTTERARLPETFLADRVFTLSRGGTIEEDLR